MLVGDGTGRKIACRHSVDWSMLETDDFLMKPLIMNSFKSDDFVMLC